MLSSFFSEIPFGAEAWELAASKIFGDKYYGLDSVQISAINDVISKLTQFGDSISAGKDANTIRLKLDSALDEVGKLVGIPYLKASKVAFKPEVVTKCFE